MVKLNIFVEGVADTTSGDHLAIDNSATFREAFYDLFIQRFSEKEFDLVIYPAGTAKQAKGKVESYFSKHPNAIYLRDLDAAPDQKEFRLSFYDETIRKKIFFMVQEMETWILSQPEAIENFAHKNGLIRKREGESIGENSLIKGKNIQDIEEPNRKLDTILRQYFDTEKKKRNGQFKRSGKRYSKTKDATELIGLLNFEKLTVVFEDAKELESHIDSLKNRNA